MEKLTVYKQIRDTAHSLKKEGRTYTRADLAYELREYGVKHDSQELNGIVWNAYKHYGNDNAIREVFLDNRGVDSLVDIGEMENHLSHDAGGEFIPVLYGRLERGEQSLSTLERLVSKNADEVGLSVDTDIAGVIVGSQGASAVQKQASDVFNRYSEMIGGYQNARNVVSSLISDFMMLRSLIVDMYRKYSGMLVDVFGESIKAVDPQLFDFDKLEWLDTQGMMQNVKLEYDQVSEKCSVLIGAISESFGQSLRMSAGAYRSSGDRTAGLMMAGVNMFLHYMGAAQRTAELKQDLLRLQNIVKHDVTVVRGDLSRLTVIYKTINDVLVPESDAFCRYSGQVISSEWLNLEKELYSKSEVRILKQKRDELLADIKNLEMDMADETSLIDFYKSRISDSEVVLKSVKPRYDKAMESKPSRPSGLVNVLSLGSSGKKYNREIYEWNQNCSPVVNQYNDLQVDIKLDTDELRQLEAALKNNRLQYQKLKTRLSDINADILKTISVERSLQTALLPHVESVIKLLRLGRRIAESKLDENLMKKVSVDNVEIDLPADVKENVRTFVDVFKDGLTIDTPVDAEPDTVMLDKVENDAVQGVMNLVQECINLGLMERRSAIASEEYDRKLSKLQASFRQYITVLDRQSDRLLESLREINTSENHEDLKASLLSLAGDDCPVFKDNDWEDFLKGNKTVEL